MSKLKMDDRSASYTMDQSKNVFAMADDIIESKKRHNSLSQQTECKSQLVNSVTLKFVEKNGLNWKEIIKKMKEKIMYFDGVSNATEGLWLLTFIPEGIEALRAEMKNEPKLLTTLLQNIENNHEAAISATGVLFNLNRANRAIHTLTASMNNDAKNNHIMISYNWAQKVIARSIADELKAAQYSTWIDVEQMHGSTLDSMASAVENAAVIIMCWSEKYQDRINCRAEAEYAFKLGRPIVPVRVEDCQASGWLNMLLGSKLYVVCEHVNQVPEQFPDILKQIQAHTVNVDAKQASGSEDFLREALSSTLANVTSDDELRQWTTKQVKEWLKENDMAFLKSKMSEFDGDLLCAYRQMNKTNPQLFYDTTHKILGIKKLSDILKLARNLERI